MKTDLKDYLETNIRLIDAHLDALLPSEKTAPETIHKAMRYSIFAGGKRLRPVLCLAACEACGGDPKNALTPACASEMLHTYSLIHDDLPCMDDDDYRRGRLTNHKVFGDGVAVLAGDALLNESFLALASYEPLDTRFSPLDFIKSLSSAGGSKNLIGGQIMDIEAEGKSNEITYKALVKIHEGKTGALLTSAIEMGGMAANATASQQDSLRRFGSNIGLAFQVIDDILDVTQDSASLGKTAGKDLLMEKATYPALLGLEKAKEIAEELTSNAINAAQELPEPSVLLVLADYLLKRKK